MAAIKPGCRCPPGNPERSAASCSAGSAPTRAGRPRAPARAPPLQNCGGALPRLLRHGRALGLDAPEVLGTRGLGGSATGCGSSHVESGGRPPDSAGISGWPVPPIRSGYRISAAFSSCSKRFWRSASSSKFTRCPVEIRAVDAGELHLSAHGHAARPAHPGAIHHDGIQSSQWWDTRRTGHFAAGLHHGSGPMATTSRTSWLAAMTSASACENEPLAAVAARHRW